MEEQPSSSYFFITTFGVAKCESGYRRERQPAPRELYIQALRSEDLGSSEGCERVKSAEGLPLLLMFILGTFLRSGKTGKTHQLLQRRFLEEPKRPEALHRPNTC